MKTKIKIKSLISLKITRLFSSLAGCGMLLLACHTPLTGAVIFQEDFDGSAYTNGENLPAGYNQINYGRWINLSTSPNTATTPALIGLSPSRALDLRKNGGGDAVALAVLGQDNTAAYTTASSISIRFAFNLADNTYSEVYVNATNSGVLGLINIGSGGGDKGAIRPYFAGAAADATLIDLDKWYYVELVMSANPTTANAGYSFSLYETDGITQVGTTLSGNFFTAPGSGAEYEFLQFINYGTENSSIYYDNISVTMIPEPGTVALLFSALATIAFSRSRRRK